MSTTLLLAVVGAGIAIIDFTGLTQWFEAKVRKWMIAAWHTAVEHFQFGLMLLAGGILLPLVLWYFGAYSQSGFGMHDPRQTAIALLGLFLMPIACFVFYCVLWLLSLPKRGVVSTLGLIMAAVGLVLELVS